MPNYFENVRQTDGIKGCSASTVKEDGSGPTNTSAAQCRVYPTEKENREQLDSCFVEKERLKIQCPRLDGFRSQVEKTNFNDGTGKGDKFGSFICVYSNNLGQRNSCNDEKSLLAAWDRQNPNWRTLYGGLRLNQLKQISCNTFLEREAEKRRLEELRRRAEEERRRREEQANRFRNFFASWRQRWEDMLRNAREQQQRKLDEQRRAREAEQARIRELEERVRNCPRR